MSTPTPITFSPDSAGSSAFSSAANSSTAAPSMSAAATFQPSETSLRTTRRPMPRGAPAPVTRAVRWAGKGWIVVVSRVMSGSPFVRCAGTAAAREVSADDEVEDEQQGDRGCPHDGGHAAVRLQGGCAVEPRSEEHTSELQSRGHLVCRLLLEKK